MQPTQPHKIPKRLISYSEGYLREKIEEDYGYPAFNPPSDSDPDGNNSRAIEAALLKYYPKYCRAIEIDQEPKSWSVISRIRQVKVVRHFLYDWSEESGDADYLRDIMPDITKKTKNLFRNKRKCVKSLPVVGFQESGWSWNKCNVTLTEMCSFFPNIKILNVSLPSSRGNPNESFVSRDLEKQILQSYGYFWDNLKHVEHLELTTFSPNLWLIFPYLQSSKRFLSSLKTFHLTIFPIPQEEKYPLVLFQVLLKNHDVLKYVTHITFQGSKYLEKFHYYGHMIHSVLGCCSKIHYLKLPIQHDFGQDGPKQSFELNLAPLKSLQNIAILNLEIYNLWGFIEVFDFPVSLKKLTLFLTLSANFQWKKISTSLEDEKISTLKEKNELLSFSERFRKLTLLNSLKLSMLRSVRVKTFMDDFVLPVLQAIPKLEELEWKFDPEEQEEPFNLAEFFDGIASLKHLKSVKIPPDHCGTKDFMMTFLPSKSYSLLNIESIGLGNRITQDFDFKKFFQMFSDGSKITLKDISFAEIYVESFESFVQILKTFKGLGQYPTLKVSSRIVLCLDNVNNLLDYFKSPIELASNITIDLTIEAPPLKPTSLSSDQIQALKHIFQNFKLDIASISPTSNNNDDEDERKESINDETDEEEQDNNDVDEEEESENEDNNNEEEDNDD